MNKIDFGDSYVVYPCGTEGETLITLSRVITGLNNYLSIGDYDLTRYEQNLNLNFLTNFSMKISSPTFKSFLENIVFLTEDMDEKGKPVPRTTFRKNLLKGVKELRKLLKESTEYLMLTQEDFNRWVEFRNKGFDKLNKKENEELAEMNGRVKIVQDSELEQNKELKAFSGRFNSSEITLDGKALETVKYYLNDREELPEFNDTDMELFNQLA